MARWIEDVTDKLGNAVLTKLMTPGLERADLQLPHRQLESQV